MRVVQPRMGLSVIYLLCAALNVHSEPTVVLDAGEELQTDAAESPDLSPEGADPALFFGPKPDYLDQYRLGIEDVLRIRVFELEQLDVVARVSGDGTIDLPLVGALNIEGLTSGEVTARIADRLRNQYLENPQVSVFIQNFNSRKIYLLGSVKRPDIYPMTGQRSLLQLLAEAGGLTPEAGKVLYVFRQSAEGEMVRLSIPLSSLQVKGESRCNIWLLPGDIVNVPPEEVIHVSVLGAVRNPGVYELPVSDRPTLLNAIAKAGGLGELASKSGLTIIRRDEAGGQTILQVDLEDVFSGKTEGILLVEGDIITLKESFW